MSAFCCRYSDLLVVVAVHSRSFHVLRSCHSSIVKCAGTHERASLPHLTPLPHYEHFQSHASRYLLLRRFPKLLSQPVRCISSPLTFHVNRFPPKRFDPQLLQRHSARFRDGRNDTIWATVCYSNGRTVRHSVSQHLSRHSKQTIAILVQSRNNKRFQC